MNQLDLRGSAFSLSTGLLTATGGVTTHDTTATINYVLNGVIRQKTAITTGATPTLDVNTGVAFPALLPSKGCAVVWMLNSSGTVQVAMGPSESIDSAGNFLRHPAWPTIPPTSAPFAYQILKLSSAGSASGVVFGVANWNATGFTNVIKNVMFLPDRPQAS